MIDSPIPNLCDDFRSSFPLGVPESIILTDRDGNIRYMSPSIVEWLGYSGDELANGTNVNRLFMDGLAPGKDLRETGPVFGLEAVLLAKGGRLRMVLVDVEWTGFWGGTVRYHLRPKSDDESTGKQIPASEAYLKRCLACIPTQLAILDDRGSIEYVNQPWRDFAGKNGALPGSVCEGANYLEVCDKAATLGRDDGGKEEKQIALAVFRHGDSVHFCVSDNGVGIPAENRDRIFNHGFTTRKEGHGFGLHSAANAARELGGRLTVKSDGPGKGATFVLEIPVQRPDNPFCKIL